MRVFVVVLFVLVDINAIMFELMVMGRRVVLIKLHLIKLCNKSMTT